MLAPRPIRGLCTRAPHQTGEKTSAPDGRPRGVPDECPHLRARAAVSRAFSRGRRRGVLAAALLIPRSSMIDNLSAMDKPVEKPTGLSRRALLVMYELDEMSCEELAEILGVPTGTVHSRLHAAREEFRAALKRYAARSLAPFVSRLFGRKS